MDYVTSYNETAVAIQRVIAAVSLADSRRCRTRESAVQQASLSRWQQWYLWRPTWRTSTLALIRCKPKLFLNDYRWILTSLLPLLTTFSSTMIWIDRCLLYHHLRWKRILRISHLLPLLLLIKVKVPLEEAVRNKM